ncbi:MAG: tRNA (adenosine(37)-N6)-threonylcarbamoyltransferase complex transferase subunit TsaD [Patescibacteria group bacterium]|nr:tRNA (adenosine(37)-N6)-threonylcarbamoyltransferase complex transferase subunit TsaD [Patescibacteria group bacterium]MCX7589911.1 tRNA (adenosine(37)-N6)-threonylcarbamoyltransferase complex transferase subunit TsaD [Patescibacteria group bacterium]MDW8279591.1 tRNA (adenosine(37)-N6)-threonylcarbamoyltransferase complex transferase subunit TsaD [bacterium]
MKILAIETSCDETSLALIKSKQDKKSNLPKFKILKNLISSQIKIHQAFGGVVPNLAKREHLKNLPILFKKLSKENLNSKSTKLKNFLKSINILTVTIGPGLEPALWTGINFTKEIINQYKTLKIPKPKIIGSNHLLGHLYSFLLDPKITKNKIKSEKEIFPAIALIVSGGHTILILMESLFKYKKLGETRDDACGESFDKVARMLNLPYPGGPQIEKIAQFGNNKAIQFPRPMINEKNYDFSFSGLKTSVFYFLRNYKTIDSQTKNDIAASFQQAAFDVLIKKTFRAANEFGAKSIMLSGGVSANKTLRNQFSRLCRNEKKLFFVPPFVYNTDNAVMIAISAFILNQKNKNYRLIARGDLNI